MKKIDSIVSVKKQDFVTEKSALLEVRIHIKISKI